MTDFTPGPWTANLGEAFHIKEGDGGTLAQVTFLRGRGGLKGRRDGDECAANAHLIAAAPDLYEALEWLLRCAEVNGVKEVDTRMGMARAHAALTKARGQ